MNNKAEQLTPDTIKSFLESHPLAVLDFWAPWCAPCVAMAPVLDQLAAQYKGRLGVGKINIDDHEPLMKAYTIASIPSFLFIKKGNEETRLVGAHPLETLCNHAERLWAPERK